MPERPRAAPEIIPPDHIAEEEARQAERIRMEDGADYARIYVTRLGPFSTILLALAAGAAAVLLLLLVVGAFLLWIPIVGLLVAAAVISALVRNFFQRR